jgi:hypothetical protein
MGVGVLSSERVGWEGVGAKRPESEAGHSPPYSYSTSTPHIRHHGVDADNLTSAEVSFRCPLNSVLHINNQGLKHIYHVFTIYAC